MQFIDDAEVQAAIDAACRLATAELARTISRLPENSTFVAALRRNIELLLTHGAGTTPASVCGHDAFGDPFNLDALPLSRPGTGYAVQFLDTDLLLDKSRRLFLPVRDPSLVALFESFDEAFETARAWLQMHPDTPMPPPFAIVPAFFDATMQRHVLIYGVLTREP